MLGALLASARERAERLDESRLRAEAGALGPAADLAAALSGPELSVIAEVKRRSPSRGDLAPGLDPAAQAAAYADGGAAAVSVLTEPRHFGGSLADLEAVRAQVQLPVLRKDFVLAPAQVWEARVAGADAVLLIVAALGDDDLRRLLAVAGEAGMTALVEIHDERETELALAAGAGVVGVNNRDLRTFTVDLGVAEILAPLLAEAKVRVAESGIDTPAAAARMAAAGYHAVLVGEALVRAADPAALVSEMAAP